MTESEFSVLSSAALTRIERALEEADPDLDLELKEGGVLEIEFPDGRKIIVNRHAAAQEIWVAAPSGGYHFRFDAGTWKDTRDGSELFAALSRLARAHAGKKIELR
jgi:CyaY protein